MPASRPPLRLRSILPLSSALLLLACATTNGTPEPASAPLAAQSPDLTQAGAFARLLAAPARPQEEPCVLTLGPAGLAPASPITPATRDMPPAVPTLDALLAASPGSARVLTPWGRLGPDGDGPAMVSLSPVPPDVRSAPAAALFLHGADFELRNVQDAEQVQSATPLSVKALGQQLMPLSPGRYTLFVTAAQAVSEQGLVDALSALPANAFVVLVSPLPGGTRLPPEPTPDPEVDVTCQELPPAASELQPSESDLPGLRESVTPIRQAVESCLADASQLTPTRVVLLLRIAQGRVIDACLQAEDSLDAVLTTCITAQAKALHFPEGPAGEYVEAALPLSLAPVPEPIPTPVCRVP